MKPLFFLTVAATLSFASGPIKLPAPNLDKGHSIMKSFSLRKSAAAADFKNAKELSNQELSELLFAANGVNRPSEGKRTAPSAMNVQDVEVYVLMKNGAWLYDAKNNALNLVANKDLRALAAGAQADFAAAPVMLVLVSDISKFPHGDDAFRHKLGAMDAGIVSQNIALFCAGTGLITRPRVSMNTESLAKELKLSVTQIPMANHPVGK